MRVARIGDMTSEQKAALVRQKERILKKNGYKSRRIASSYTRVWWYTWHAPDGSEIITIENKQSALNVAYRHYLDCKVKQAEEGLSHERT